VINQQQSAMRGCQIARFLFNRKLAMLQEVSRQNLKQLRERLTDLLRDSGGNLKLSRLKDRHNIDQSTVYRLVSLYPGEFEIYHKRNAFRGPIPEFVALRAFPDRQVNGEACA